MIVLNGLSGQVREIGLTKLRALIGKSGAKDPKGRHLRMHPRADLNVLSPRDHLNRRPGVPIRLSNAPNHHPSVPRHHHNLNVQNQHNSALHRRNRQRSRIPNGPVPKGNQSACLSQACPPFDVASNE
jgi:hypothetical protein